jgi:WD40 repeat protein
VPFHTFSKLQAQEIAWCADAAAERLAVLTVEKRVVVCSIDGANDVIEAQSEASSSTWRRTFECGGASLGYRADFVHVYPVSWSPSGDQLAVGLVDGTIAVYARSSLQVVRSIDQPESCAKQNLGGMVVICYAVKERCC